MKNKELIRNAYERTLNEIHYENEDVKSYLTNIIDIEVELIEDMSEKEVLENAKVSEETFNIFLEENGIFAESENEDLDNLNDDDYKKYLKLAYIFNFYNFLSEQLKTVLKESDKVNGADYVEELVESLEKLKPYLKTINSIKTQADAAIDNHMGYDIIGVIEEVEKLYKFFIINEHMFKSFRPVFFK